MDATLYSSLLTSIASSTGNLVLQGTNVATSFMGNSAIVYALFAGAFILWAVRWVRGKFGH